MFSPQEEATLKRLARENPPPLFRPDVQYKEEPAVGWNDLVYRSLAAGKLRAVNLDEDHEIVHKVKHTMKKGEHLGEWYARTQIGRAQILQMDKDEITHAVARAEQRNLNEVQEPKPPKFTQNQPTRRPIP
jgi:hypothetical protein